MKKLIEVRNGVALIDQKPFAIGQDGDLSYLRPPRLHHTGFAASGGRDADQRPTRGRANVLDLAEKYPPLISREMRVAKYGVLRRLVNNALIAAVDGVRRDELDRFAIADDEDTFAVGRERSEVVDRFDQLSRLAAERGDAVERSVVSSRPAVMKYICELSGEIADRPSTRPIPAASAAAMSGRQPADIHRPLSFLSSMVL